MKKYGFGIVGCGAIADVHAAVIGELSNGTLVGVYDKAHPRSAAFAEKQGCRSYATYEEMLADEAVEVVCICTPSGLHAPLILDAVKAGKHFIVEKPMAITEEQIDAIQREVKQAHVKGAVISQYRFVDGIQILKKAVADGLLGKIILGDIYMKYNRSEDYYASSGWRGTWAMDGGGALMNQGIHGVDAMQYILGPVRAISGVCRTLVHDIEVEDTAVFSVEYESGAIGTIQGTTSVTPGYPRRIEISGTKGTVILVEGEIVSWDVKDVPKPEMQAQAKNHSFNNPISFSIEHHKIQFEDLLSAIENDREPLVNVDEGSRAVKIILSAYRASKEGKRITL